jgi:hypothetical protein
MWLVINRAKAKTSSLHPAKEAVMALSSPLESGPSLNNAAAQLGLNRAC